MPNWKKVIVSGSDASLSSLIVNNGVTGSLQGTASWANNVVSASYALNSTSASYALTAASALNASDILIYVKNSTGAQINKGVVVRISGSVGDNPLISTASYTDDANSANTLGITNENIPHDAFGYVMTEGRLLGIDTSAFTDGQLLYLGATGSIIGTAPVAPLHAVRLGQVLRVQLNAGSMYVRIDNGYELGELHDVRDTTTTSSYGDLLVKSGSIWINSRQLTGSYGLTGSLNATSFTGSLFGTASWANNATTASYALVATSASYAATASFIPTSSLTGNFFVQGGNSFGTQALLGTNDVQNLAFETSGSVRMTISSSGNVGVGVTTPVYPLEVNGKIYSSTEVQGGTAFINDTGGISVFGSNTSTRSIRLGRNGTLNDIFITGSSGNVGIGTATPAALLDVYTSGTTGTTTMLLLKRAAGYGYTSFEQSYDSTFFANGKTLTLKNDAGLAYAYFAGNNAGTITNLIIPSGSIGIGTTSPAQKLSISGSTGDILGITNGTTTGYGYVDNNGFGFFTAASAGGTGTYYRTSNIIDSYINGSIAVRITSTGNVGINTTTPQDKLTVKGATNYNLNLGLLGSYSAIYVYNDASSAYNHLRIDASPLIINSYSGGNVGIGSASPAFRLDVSGNSRMLGGSVYLGQALTASGHLNAYELMTFNIDVDNNDSNRYFAWYTNAADGAGTELMRLTEAGKVGIGTTAPSNLLDVTTNLDAAQRVAIFRNLFSTGYTSIAIDRPNTARYSFLEHTTAGTTDWYVGTGYNGGGGNSAYQIGTGINLSDAKLMITTGGNVGIGTTSPTARLDVSGSLYVQAKSSLTNNSASVSYTTNAQKLDVTFNTAGWIASFGAASTSAPIYYTISGDNNTNVIGSNAYYSGSGYNLVFTDRYATIQKFTPQAGATSAAYAIEIISSSGVNPNTPVSAMQILNNGNVGIGTTSPGAKLVVNGTTWINQTTDYGGAASKVQISAGSSSDNVVIRTNSLYLYSYSSSFETLLRYGNGSETWNIGTTTGTTPDFRLYELNGASTRLTVKAGGSVGIGTTSPAYLLDVNGAGNFSGSVWVRNGNNLRVYNTANNDWAALSYDTNRLNINNIVYLQNAGGVNSFYPSASGVTDIGRSSFLFRDAYFTGFTVTGSNVGIGTSSPGSRLDIYDASNALVANFNSGQSTYVRVQRAGTSIGDFGSANALVSGGSVNDFTVHARSGSNLVFAYNFGEIARFNTSGNLGIGTTSPTSPLHLYKASADALLTIERSDAGSGAREAIKHVVGSSTTWTLGTVNFNEFYINVNAAERLRITSNGSVGIGTITPVSPLHVNGVVSIGATSVSSEGSLFLGPRGTTEGGQIFLQAGTSYTSASMIDMYQNGADPYFRILRGTNTASDALIAQFNTHTKQFFLPSYTSTASFAGTATAYLAVNSSGDVITVAGTSGASLSGGSTNYVARWASSTTLTTGSLFDNGTNVGIGTITPGNKLDVWGGNVRFVASASSDALVRIIAANYATEFDARLFLGENDTNGMTFEYDGANNIGFIGMNSSTDPTGSYSQRIRMSRDGSEVVFPAGSVGIGTTSPNYRFTVGNSNGSAAVHIGGGNSNSIPAIAIQSDFVAWASSQNGFAYYYNATNGNLDLYRKDNSVTENQVMTWVRASGNVGIGTTSPTARLHVSASTGVVFEVDGASAATILYVTASGNVGIGTTSPYDKLEVNGAIAATGGSGGSSAQGHATIIQASGGVSYLTAVDWGAEFKPLVIEGNYIIFKTGTGSTSDKVYIGNNGNVGIGTTAPLSKLQVSSGFITAGNQSSVAGSIILQGYYNDGSLVTLGGEYSNGGPVLGYAVTPSTASAEAFVSSTGINVSRGAYVISGNIHRWHSGAAQIVSVGGAVTMTEKMRLDASGNLGIGTSSPSFRTHIKSAGLNTVPLAVQRAANTNNIFYIYEDASGNGTLTIETSGGSTGAFIHSSGNSYFSGGNVGIGTTNPTALLTLDSAEPRIRLNRTGVQHMIINHDGTTGTIRNESNTLLQIGTNGTAVMNITGSNVGIGTTNPATLLALAGSTSTTFGLSLQPSGWNSAKHRFTVHTSGDTSMWSFNWNGSAVDSALYSVASISITQGVILFNTTGSANSPAERMRLNANGNLGIGNSNPSYLLDIAPSAGGAFATARINNGYTGGSDGSQILLGNSANFTNAYIRLNGGGNGSQAGSGSLNIGVTQAVDMALYTNNVERIRILSGGSVGIGSISPAYALDVNGTGRFTAIIETSTRTLKDNIQSYATEIDKFKQLEPVSFTWKETGKQDVGLIAEDVEQIFPEFVSKTDDGDVQGINYGKLATIFINVLKQQQEKIELLEEQIKKLTS